MLWSCTGVNYIFQKQALETVTDEILPETIPSTAKYRHPESSYLVEVTKIFLDDF